MNVEVRFFDRNRDFDGTLKILTRENTFIYRNRENIPSMLENMANDSLFVILLTIVNDEIIGVCIMKEWEFQPCWNWCYWDFAPGKLTAIWLEQGFTVLKLLDHHVFEEMETNRGLRRWFFSHAVHGDSKALGIRTAGNWERFISAGYLRKYNLRSHNYTYFDDSIISAGTQGKYPYQRAIMLDTTYSCDIRIRVGILNSPLKDTNVD
jgi:hypothetical protein